MRILVICPHYAPDTAPTGVVMTEIAEQLIELGHELHIVTSLPWYERHRIEEGWNGRPWRREQTEWGTITRVHPFPTDKTNVPARAFGFAGFTVMAFLAALLQRRRPHVVLTMSPPLTLGFPGWIVARLRRSAFVFNVQDIFPDVAIEVGAISSPRVIRVLRALESFTYRRADAVTVLSSDLRDNVVVKIGRQDPAKVRIIPNFVDTERIQPVSSETSYRREIGAGDRTVVMYAGNIGLSQPLELVLDTARRWTDRSDVLFVINGGGSERARLEQSARDLDSVVFVDFQTAERLPEVLASGDIHLITLRTGLAYSSVPSKLYSILAAGRPVLASIDEGTEVSRVLDENGCGVSVPPEDLDAFESALADLITAIDERREMGERGRTFVERWASPAAVAAMYHELFADLA